jgi:phage terminase small subunit
METPEFDPLALELTAKQERYCQLAAVTSYADAYRDAYNPGEGYNYHSDIWKLNRLPKIAKRIRELMADDNSHLGVTREWLLKWWFYRMIYDPAEITAWAVGACRFCHGDGHEYQWRVHEYLKALEDAENDKHGLLPDIAGGFGFDATKPPADDCPGCHGKGVGRSDIADTSKLSPMARAAFEGIKETRNGIEIKMADKDKAAENFAKLSGMDVVQVRVMADKLPGEEDLEGLQRNPVAAAAAYQRMLGHSLH